MTASESFTSPEGDDDVLLAFLRELEATGDRSEVVERYCRLFPGYAGEIRDLVATRDVFALSATNGCGEIPETLGDFRIIRRMARGGMGDVYEAVQGPFGRRVALKTIREDYIHDEPEIQARFVREREVLARLHHTHIVPIHAAGQVGPLHYFAMPYIEGATLSLLIGSARTRESTHPGSEVPSLAKLAEESSANDGEPRRPDLSAKPPPTRLNLSTDYFRSVARVMADASDAVQHAHDVQIVHRDLKPTNLMVDRDGHCWVLDFGLASLGDERARPQGLPGEGPPAASGRMGAPRYMAPEQFECKADERTDVWGLGVTLYELLTLRRAFDSSERITNGEPRPMRDLVVRPLPDLDAICRKALRKDPADRYRTAREFGDDLRRWLRHEPVAARPARTPRRVMLWSRRNPGWAAATAAAILLCGIALYASEVKRQRSEQHEQSLKREIGLLALPQLRAPIRRMGWFPKSWEHARSLRGGGTSPDPRLQEQAAAALEGIDCRAVKTLPGTARQLEFDPRSERLLIVRGGVDGQDKAWSRTTLWDRAADRDLVERDLGPGVVAFRPDGTPLQASVDRDDPARLRLYDVGAGKELHTFRSSLPGPSALTFTALSRDGSRLAAAAFTFRKQDGKLVIDAEGATTIAVWDTGTGRQVGTLEHKATQGLVLSPDGRMLAAWNSEGEITVWTLSDGKPLSRFRVGRAPVTCLTFGRDAFWHEDESSPPWLLAVGESSGLVTVCDLRVKRPRSVCRGSFYEVRSMDFSADGTFLLTAGRRPAKLWDVATGSCVININDMDMYNKIVFAPDGRHVAAGLDMSWAPRIGVEVLELELGHGTRTLYGLQGAVEKAAWSPDGRFVAAVTHEWQIGLWEWPSGRLLGVLPAPIGHFVDSIGMAFDPGGRRFACSVGHRAMLWDLETRRSVGWDFPEGLSNSLVFIGRDRLLLARQETKSREGGPFTEFPSSKFPRVVRVYDLLSATPTRPLAEITDFDADIRHLQFAPDGSLLAVDGSTTARGVPGRRFRVYEGSTGKLLRDLPTTRVGRTLSHILFDPSSTVLLAGLEPIETNTLHQFDLPGLTYRGTTDVPSNCLNPGASRTMGRAFDGSNTLILSDLARGRPLLRVVNDIGGSVMSIGFSPDGRHVVFGREDGSVSVLDLVETNRKLSELHLGW